MEDATKSEETASIDQNPVEQKPDVDPVLARQQELTQELQQNMQQFNGLNQQAAQISAMMKNLELEMAGIRRAINELKRLSEEE